MALSFDSVDGGTTLATWLRYAPFGAYAAGGAGLALVGPDLWGVMPETAALAALATTASFSIGHLMARTVRRTRELATTVARQALTMQALSLRLATVSGSIEAVETRLETVPSAESLEDMRGTLRDLSAALSGRASMAAVVKPNAPRSKPAAAKADDSQIAQLVRDAIADARVDLHLQPIVQLPNRGTVHYEAFSRVRDVEGRVVMPSEFLPAVEAAGLASALDNLQLARCITLTRRLGDKRPDTRIFCNLSGRALAEPAFLAEIIRFMRADRELANRIVFEVGACDLAALDPEALRGLDGLSQLGFGFSIDGYSSNFSDDIIVAVGGVRFVKMDADAFLAEDGEALVAGLRRRGIDVIATRVESERQVVELLDLGVGFAQGYLFGHPRPARLDTEQEARAA